VTSGSLTEFVNSGHLIGHIGSVAQNRIPEPSVNLLNLSSYTNFHDDEHGGVRVLFSANSICICNAALVNPGILFAQPPPVYTLM
jgi:hypothetical protein